MSDELFHFKRFLADVSPDILQDCYDGAVEKFNVLYPGRKVITYDQRTLGLETDDLDAPNGYDIYELGLVDEEMPAMKCTRTERIITYRIH